MSADKASKCTDLTMLAQYLKEGRFKNCVVLVGAGISVAAGIPDFRTPGTGLYDNLSKYKLPYPEAVFSMDFFKSNPRPFFHLARDYKGILRRIYTQNIDTLERIAGIPEDKLVEAHGSFATATCTSRTCRRQYSMEWMEKQIFGNEDDDTPQSKAKAVKSPPPSSSSTTGPSVAPTPLRQFFSPVRERADVTPKKHAAKYSSEAVRIPRCEKCNGVVKPDIVFFGEDLPDRFHELVKGDTAAADLLLVIGTSLKVAVVHALPASRGSDDGSDDEGDSVLAMLNRLSLGGARYFRFGHKDNTRDVLMQMNADDGVLQLAEQVGWRAELEAMVAASRAPSAAGTSTSEDGATAPASSGVREGTPSHPSLPAVADAVAASEVTPAEVAAAEAATVAAAATSAESTVAPAAEPAPTFAPAPAPSSGPSSAAAVAVVSAPSSSGPSSAASAPFTSDAREPAKTDVEPTGVFAVTPVWDCPHCVPNSENGTGTIMGGETVENMKRLLHPDTVAEGSERAAPFGCAQCTEAEEVWLCLACRAVGCSRYVGGHGAAHAEASHGHSLAVSLADMSVWCYPCSAYVDVHKVPGTAGGRDLRHAWATVYEAKFGEAPPLPKEGP